LAAIPMLKTMKYTPKTAIFKELHEFEKKSFSRYFFSGMHIFTKFVT
jgi:hypothetical protein